MENLNFINFMYVADLAILSLIDYLDSVDNNLVISEQNQIYLDLSKRQKDILTSFIIEHLLHAWQYGKKNIIYASCKPILNWRQSQRDNNPIKTYKYKLMDNSIYIDLIKLNQFLDTIFNKLQKINLNNLKYNNILKSNDISKFTTYKETLNFISLDNIDSTDLCVILKEILINIASCSFINSSCNILQDGNDEYVHTKIRNPNIVDLIREKLVEINIL